MHKFMRLMVRDNGDALRITVNVNTSFSGVNFMIDIEERKFRKKAYRHVFQDAKDDPEYEKTRHGTPERLAILKRIALTYITQEELDEIVRGAWESAMFLGHVTYTDYY